MYTIQATDEQERKEKRLNCTESEARKRMQEYFENDYLGLDYFFYDANDNEIMRLRAITGGVAMLKENDFVKSAFIRMQQQKIKMGNYNKVFGYIVKMAFLGIDWNTSRSLYTNHGDIFTPFRCFASCVEFEKVETGEKFHFDNIINGILKLRKSLKLEDRSGGSLFYYVKIKFLK